MGFWGKVATGSFALIALGLLLSKPAGTTALGAAGSNAYATGVKAYTAF